MVHNSCGTLLSSSARVRSHGQKHGRDASLHNLAVGGPAADMGVGVENDPATQWTLHMEHKTI